MSAIHGVAWGVLEVDGTNIKRWRKEVRDELRTHRITLHPTSARGYSLIRRRDVNGKKIRQRLGHGDLKRCCEIASRFLTPSNPEK